MIFDNGFFIMNGTKRGDKFRVRTADELIGLVNEVGFLPLFSNKIKGFSVEEHVPAGSWWTGDVNTDPWEWRETISRGKQVAYGKFFGKKAGYISREWLPYFVNYRRDGYDFDARYQDGLANRRQKLIMDFYMGDDANGEIVWKKEEILSTELKKLAGFGKGGEKNYPGIVTDLQMMLYLVITDFRRRVNNRVASSPVSDFLIDGMTFEVGGKNKKKKQIETVENGFVVKDDIEHGFLNTIPLWAFGLNY